MYFQHVQLKSNYGILIFASIKDLVENEKINAEWSSKIGIDHRPNRYIDMHYFFLTLQSKRFLPDFSKVVPTEVLEFVNRIIPENLRSAENNRDVINDRGRLLQNIEYTTPLDVLISDPFFKKYVI